MTFYREILGLRLVKKTVNFDDKIGYHLYFGSQSAPLGLLITFFSQQFQTGHKGSGQVGKIAFRVLINQLDYWENHLKSFGIKTKKGHWFHHKALYFNDFDQLELALVASAEVSNNPEIKAFHGLSIYSSQPQASKEFLEKTMGFAVVSEDEEHFYLKVPGKRYEELLIEKFASPANIWGVGTIHHVAWSIFDEIEEKAWRKFLIDEGRDVTVLRDRK
ncbi:ring-cleaving dioxygenase, partial [Streptococcus pluranimalium]|uniref:ring-cleaving dioxygenase n=1 Tax=Streptococcus pluranimalium TaxID=82348 RepID=UPI0039FD9998